tara:strand:- start:2656 stop:4590 length:1935 start_codon:yes stop_codon:yes gene_type:complete
MADNNKKTRNPTSDLFRGLTRLFSGPIIKRRQQNYRRERRRSLKKYEFTSAAGKQFKKHSKDPFDSLAVGHIVERSRGERYGDFDQMEYMPEVASALDIYADEMTYSSQIQKMLRIDCKNEEIKGVLHSLYHNIMNIEANLFGWCRSLCKYGDYFLYLDIDEHIGISNVIGLPTHQIERMEGEDKTNPNYVQYQWNDGGLTFENWQCAHFRILGNDRYAPYGTSILEPARRIWRQLTLLEDAMMAYRIVRSPERRVFYIDVGNISPNDVEQYIQKVMTQMKRNSVIDEDTGRVDLRYNPMSVEEDYFIPVRGGTSSRVETLAGGQYTGDIDDVKYLREKLFSALKIPQAYLAQSDAMEDKTTLSQKDIRFARTVQRLQRSIVAELEKIGVVHLYTLGYRQDDLISFKLYLNNPSKIAELQELESWRTKFEISAAATEGFFSRRWIATNLLGISEEEFIRNQREMFYDRRYLAELEKVAEEVATGEEAAGGGFAEDFPAEELPAEEFPPEEAAEEIPGGEEAGPLLATPEEPPAKRDVRKDGSYLTKGAKGKRYKPVRDDKRKHMAPRKKHYMAQYDDASARATTRNIFKGISPGAKEMLGLAKGINEDKGYNYKEEEEKLFELDKNIKDIILSLENDKNEKTET